MHRALNVSTTLQLSALSRCSVDLTGCREPPDSASVPSGCIKTPGLDAQGLDAHCARDPKIKKIRLFRRSSPKDLLMPFLMRIPLMVHVPYVPFSKFSFTGLLLYSVLRSAFFFFLYIVFRSMYLVIQTELSEKRAVTANHFICDLLDGYK